VATALDRPLPVHHLCLLGPEAVALVDRAPIEVAVGHHLLLRITSARAESRQFFRVIRILSGGNPPPLGASPYPFAGACFPPSSWQPRHALTLRKPNPKTR